MASRPTPLDCRGGMGGGQSFLAGDCGQRAPQGDLWGDESTMHRPTYQFAGAARSCAASGAEHLLNQLRQGSGHAGPGRS